MKIGLALPMFTSDASRPLKFADRADALGYDGVFAADHLLPPTGPEQPSLEAFTTLAAVAACHPRLHVGTLVARVTLRAPGLLAKEAAALDEMSGGKAILGLGTGDMQSRPEHDAFGIPLPPLSERRAILEETALALRCLFGGETWPGGRYVRALAGPLEPPGAPEIWVGGISEAAVGIAGGAADGWNGWALDAEGFAARAALLRDLAPDREVAPTWGGIALVGEDETDVTALRAARVGRGLSEEIWSGTSEELRNFVDGLAAAGGTWAIILPAGPADRVELIATTLLEQ